MLKQDRAHSLPAPPGGPLFNLSPYPRMKLPLVVLTSLAGALVLSAAPAAITSNAAPYPKDAKSSVESFDPAFATLVAADAVVENLASGFRWSEGPVWDPAQGALLFSDVPENRVYRWKDGAGITILGPAPHRCASDSDRPRLALIIE